MGITFGLTGVTDLFIASLSTAPSMKKGMLPAKKKKKFCAVCSIETDWNILNPSIKLSLMSDFINCKNKSFSSLKILSGIFKMGTQIEVLRSIVKPQISGHI